MSFFSWLSNIFQTPAAPAPAPSKPASQPLQDPQPPPPAFDIPPAKGFAGVVRPADLPPGNHYASTLQAKMEAEYRYLWWLLGEPGYGVLPGWRSEAVREVAIAQAHRSDYLGVASVFGSMPWFVVALLNLMEQGQKFSGTLLNGDPWDKVTFHYPSGLGPWNSWREAAIFAINHEAKGQGWNLLAWSWTLESTLYFMECYNGRNARLPEGEGILPPHASPYIYSGTPFYTRGKRVEYVGADGRAHGRFDPDLISQQLGCMAFLKALEASGEKLF